MVMHEYTKVAAARSPALDGIEFHVVSAPPGSGIENRSYGEVVMKPMESEAIWRAPSFWLTMHNAKKLMDDLWNAGIRPTEMSETEGALKATKEHLADMRDIAFRFLDDHYILNVQDKTIDE